MSPDQAITPGLTAHHVIDSQRGILRTGSVPAIPVRAPPGNTISITLNALDLSVVNAAMALRSRALWLRREMEL